MQTSLFINLSLSEIQTVLRSSLILHFVGFILSFKMWGVCVEKGRMLLSPLETSMSERACGRLSFLICGKNKSCE